MVLRKSTCRPLLSVKRPSSKTCNSKLKISGCAFSISSSNTTAYGLRRIRSVNCPPSSYPTYPGGAPISRLTANFSIYSLISIRTKESGESNIYVASNLARCVLPTPVGPRKINVPMGLSGSFSPARLRGWHAPWHLLPGPVQQALFKDSCHLHQPVRFRLRHTAHRNLRNHRHHFCNSICRHVLSVFLLLFVPAVSFRCSFPSSSFSFSRKAEPFIVFLINGGTFFHHDTVQLLFQFGQRLRKLQVAYMHVRTASSITSMALSGRHRSVIYRWESLAGIQGSRRIMHQVVLFVP